MRIVVQIGFKRTQREGQKINAWHNEDEINWQNNEGKFLTALSDRTFRTWYLAEIEVEPGDYIHIRCQTGLRGKGSDEVRTFDSIFAVGSKTDSVEEITIPGVGFRGYPIIKGRVLEQSNVSKDELRQQDAENLLNSNDF